MNRYLRVLGGMGLLSALALGGIEGTRAQEEGFEPRQPAVPAGVEVQTRGPVHEAFAQPADMKAEPSSPVEQAPPPPVEELPPEQRPEGDNVQFVPGYWSWDPDQKQYMWVSGIYRNPPEGKQWIPGNWTNTPEGWRWVPGFWAAENQTELQYVPEPPAPLTTEPSAPAPDDNCSYVSGYWDYVGTRYVWRAGYWRPFRLGRVWVPPRYIWTPSGYLFVPGYDDYPFDQRGLLFAPIVFTQPVWRTPGWHYRPAFVLSFGVFFDSAFYRPGSLHFYFGNYYGPAYVRFGYRPWFSGYGHYDPLFAYHRWHNHLPPTWLASQKRIYGERIAGRLPGPPISLAQQATLLKSGIAGKTVVNVAAPITQVKTINQNITLVKNTPKHIEAQKAVIQRTRDFAKLRVETTQPKIAVPGAAKTTEARVFKLPAADARIAVGTSKTTNGPAILTKPITPPVVINTPKTTDTKVLSKTLEGNPSKIINNPPPKIINNPPPPPKKGALNLHEGPTIVNHTPTVAPHDPPVIRNADLSKTIQSAPVIHHAEPTKTYQRIATPPPPPQQSAPVVRDLPRFNPPPQHSSPSSGGKKGR